MLTLSQFLLEKYSFSCVMVKPEESFCQHVLNWSHDNIPDFMLYTDTEKGREDDIHVTVKYGIYGSNYELIYSYLKKVKPFYVSIKGISCFEKDDCDVLKLDVESNQLVNLHNLFKNNVPNKETYPIYHPHLTLAYIKKGYKDDLIRDTSREIGSSFLVNRFVYTTNEDHRYEMDI